MRSNHLSLLAAASLATGGLAFFVPPAPVLGQDAATPSAQQQGQSSQQPKPADYPAGQQTAQPAGQRQAGAAGQASGQSAEQVIANWPEVAKKAFKEMQAKYGEPSGVTPTRLVWTDKAPFTEIILLGEAINHDFPKPHKDCLEHVVEFKVPAEKVGDLAKFDGSVIVDRTRGTLSARCDSEAHNIVALNLAYQIINGKIDVEKAREMYTQGAKQEMQGKMPEMAKQLMFQPMPNAGDSDKVTLDSAKGGEPQTAGAREETGQRKDEAKNE